MVKLTVSSRLQATCYTLLTMPRKSPIATDVQETRAEVAQIADTVSRSSGTDEKLDIIIELLERMDKRDKLRMVGGFYRGLLSLIPILLLIWSTWYFIAHGSELMSQITKQAVQQSADYQQNSLMDQFNQYMNK